MITVDTKAAAEIRPKMVRVLDDADLAVVAGGYQQVWLGVMRAILQFDRATALRNQACHPSLYE